MAVIQYDNFIGTNNKVEETRIICLGENQTTNEVDVYVVGVVENSDLSGVTKRYLNLLSEDNYINGNNGQIIANMKSNTTAPEGTFDFEASINFAMQNKKAKAGISTNLLEAIILGQGFYKDNNFIKIIGTNGFLAKNKCEINVPKASAVFAFEILNVQNGEMDGDRPKFIPNNFVKREVPSVALETYTLLDSGNTASTLIPCVYTANSSFSQADDASKMSVSFMRPCDTWDATESILTGAREVADITDLNKAYLEVDYMVTAVADPTDFGVNGDRICIINPTTGAFAIKTSDGTSTWTADVVGGFVPYAKITTNKLTTSTIALATDQRTLAVVTGVGGENNAGFVVNSRTEASKRFTYSIYTPENETWSLYAPVGVTC